MTKNEAASVAQRLDVAEIAKAAWDEAWRIAFSEGMSAGHPLGRSYLDCDTEWADSEIVARLAQAAPPAAPVQDAGLKAAADFIQRKADDYAMEFGSDDMGSLSFGNDAMRDYHWGLLELADEIRALAAPAAPASEPVAWISYDTLTKKERIGRLPVQSLQPGVYKHTPLYAAPAPTQGTQEPCPHCHGEGLDGDPGDEPGTGYTWKCEDCDGTGRVQYRTVPVNPTPEMVDAAYLHPEKLPAAAKKSMADCIRRAILAAPAQGTQVEPSEARDAARYRMCEDLCMYFTDTMGDRIGISLPIPWPWPPLKSTAEVFRGVIDAALSREQPQGDSDV